VPPRLAREGRWYRDHTALVISTLKWALLGALAGLCVGEATRAFLWSLGASGRLVSRTFAGDIRPYYVLPLALPVCVWLIRTGSDSALNHRVH
jgi:H+/Cl- antiporter ClcA